MTLTPIEIATGIVFGSVRRPQVLDTSKPPEQALEAAVRPALERGRTFVSFSGGRDSSVVLASAVAVAHRYGLEEPVPVTIRARGVPLSHESDWQELVVAHLGVADWIRLEIDDELDVVGPYARRALARHGLLWPFNAHFHAPMLEATEGGTLLTGVGGDQLWDAARAPHVRRRRRALALAPQPLRQAVLARREPADFPWLRPWARQSAKVASAHDTATMPFNAMRRMRWMRNMRTLAVGTDALDRLAADTDATIAHPLLDLGVWGALAAAAPRTGYAERDAPLAAVARHLLPADVIARRTKAGFDGVFFHDHARAFVREWAGDGIPERVVDVRALRDHWCGDAPEPHSLTLLQSAWLASAGDRVEQPIGRRAE